MNTNYKNDKPWRQKWEQVVAGNRSNQSFHTWHSTQAEADEFIASYYAKFDGHTPPDYFHMIGQPTQHANLENEPLGKFILTPSVPLRVLTLA